MPPVLDPGLDRNPILASLDPEGRRLLHERLGLVEVTPGTRIV